MNFPTPIITTLINKLRDSQTDALHFRLIIQQLARLLVYEAFEHIHLEQRTISTWLGETSHAFIKEDDLDICPYFKSRSSYA